MLTQKIKSKAGSSVTQRHPVVKSGHINIHSLVLKLTSWPILDKFAWVKVLLLKNMHIGW